MFKEKDFRKKFHFRKAYLGIFPLTMVYIKAEVLIRRERDSQLRLAMWHSTMDTALESRSSGACGTKYA